MTNDIRDGHYTLGIAYLNAERYHEAITHFQESVALDATFIEGYHALALAHFGAHRLKDAKAAALEVLKIDATHAPTLSFLHALDPGAFTLPKVSIAMMYVLLITAAVNTCLIFYLLRLTKHDNDKCGDARHGYANKGGYMT